MEIYTVAPIRASLLGQRIALRAYTEQVKERAHLLCPESDVWQSGPPWPTFRCGVEGEFDRPIYGIFRTTDDALLGTAAIDAYDNSELAYWLHPSYRGKGFAFDACSTLLKHWFECNHPDAQIRIYQGNKPSLKLAERLGFEFHYNWFKGDRHILKSTLRAKDFLQALRACA